MESTPEDPETGFQLNVKLVADITEQSLPGFMDELRALRPEEANELTVNMAVDVCPQAGVTYLEKVRVMIIIIIIMFISTTTGF